jgi:hypothetical protein
MTPQICSFKDCTKEIMEGSLCEFVFSRKYSNWYQGSDKKISKSYCEEHDHYVTIIRSSLIYSLSKDEGLFKFYAAKIGLEDEECPNCKKHLPYLYKNHDFKRTICKECGEEYNKLIRNKENIIEQISNAVKCHNKHVIDKYEKELDEVCKNIYEMTKKINL